MSFLSVEPQSRVVSENYSNSILAPFDSHLGIIEDRYLAFFRERSLNPVPALHVTLTRTVQSSGEPSRQHSQSFSNKPNLPGLISLLQSIESLRKLHHKAKTVDASIDPHAEPSTTRAAWNTLRDNLERGMCYAHFKLQLGRTGIAEANTQQAFVDILDNDVIEPLATFNVNKISFMQVSLF